MTIDVVELLSIFRGHGQMDCFDCVLTVCKYVTISFIRMDCLDMQLEVGFYTLQPSYFVNCFKVF